MSVRSTLTAFAAIASLGVALPVDAAQSVGYRPIQDPNQLRFRVGSFEPDGDSRYWDETAFDFTGEASDFEDLVGAIDYRRRLGGRMSLVASVTGFEGESSLAYRDFVDDSGRDIVHDALVEISSGTVGLAWTLTGPSARIQPSLGGGIGLYGWRLEETGDFIDFGAADPFIFTDTFEDDGAAFGWYFSLGLDVPISDAVSLFGEARWDNAEDELSGDFEGLGDLDLSGRQLSLGLALSF